jgi:membrane protease YdiL (CAAX protease family)
VSRSKTSIRRRFSLVEALAVFGLIMAYIWRFRSTHPWSWTIIFAIILLSHIVRGERPGRIGFRARGFGACLLIYGPAVALLVAAVLAGAMALGTSREMTLRGAALSLALYLAWGLFQEYLLNGYLLNRLESALPRDRAAPLAAMLFSLVHLPNWFLMMVTLAGAFCAGIVYRRHNNLYFLGLAHAILGFTIFVAAPDWLIHHLRVGPGWFRH